MASRSYFGKMNSTLGSVVPLAMFLLSDMIKYGAIANSYAPVADRHTGERRKVVNQGDLGSVN